MKLKMKVKLAYVLLLLIFILNLVFRISFVVKTDNLSSDFSYFHLRNLENFINNGELKYDDLSYSGREIVYPMFFYYFIGFFTNFMSASLALKFIPEILISFLPIIIFFIVKLIVKNSYIALFCSLISGFIPVVLQRTLNQGSIYSLALPIIFFMFYLFLYLIYNKKNVYLFLIFSFILALVHPIAFIFVLALIFYTILLISESMSLKGIKREAILFSIFVITIVQFIVFNKAFLEYGLNFIYGNTPKELLSFAFTSLTYIGIIPIIFGSIGIYIGIFRYRKNSVYLFSSLILGILLLLVLNLIDYYIAMTFVALSFCVLTGVALKQFLSYLEFTKFSNYKIFFIISLIVLGVFSIYPVFGVAYNVIDKTITNEEIDVIQRIGGRIDDNSTVLADIEEGHYINYFANSKNVADTYFLMAPNVEERLSDIKSVYNSWNGNMVLDTLKKYRVRYIYLSERTKLKYNLQELRYAKDGKCFTQVEQYKGNKFYQVEC